MRLSRLSGTAQMGRYELEIELLHMVRPLFTDLTEEEIIERWGPPDDADSRSKIELERKTRDLHKKRTKKCPPR